MNFGMKLTVFFEEPFWVGVFERYDSDCLSVCHVVFGAEPKDNEVFDYVLKNFYNLKFSVPVSGSADRAMEKKINPKRLQRDVKRETEDRGIGTKAQLAVKQQQESIKIERRIKSREEREKEKEAQFELRQQKKKEKHKGH